MSVYLQRNQFGKHLILLVFFIKEKKAAKVVISKKNKTPQFFRDASEHLPKDDNRQKDNA